MKKYIVMILLGCAAMAIHPPTASGQNFMMRHPLIGKAAEEFTLKSLGGEETSLSELRDGGKAIVFFWATWCPTCRVTIEHFPDRLDDLKENDIAFIVVDAGEPEAVVRRYAKRYNVNLDVFLDEKGEVADEYGLYGLPSFYFIGEDGVIRNVLNVLPRDLENVFYGM